VEESVARTREKQCPECYEEFSDVLEMLADLLSESERVGRIEQFCGVLLDSGIPGE
jgi:hypothetical protein